MGIDVLYDEISVELFVAGGMRAVHGKMLAVINSSL
jgi:hypothetical protein